MDWDWDDIFEVALDYWTVTMFLPAILLLLAALAVITRFSDRRAERR